MGQVCKNKRGKNGKNNRDAKINKRRENIGNEGERERKYKADRVWNFLREMGREAHSNIIDENAKKPAVLLYEQRNAHSTSLF